MNVRITDKHAFEALSPLDVGAYLRSMGWRLKGWMGEVATVWAWENESVLLPENPSLADYARRMAEVLETLSTTEQRSQLEILRDLATATADVIRVRVASPAMHDGSVGLQEGVTLIAKTSELVLSAARAAVFPRAYYRSRLPGAADEYMRRVRLGQTEQGSYVVTVVCPVSPELQVPSLQLANAVEEPFERKVTRTLASALHRITSATREAAHMQAMEPFTAAVSEGVSANLCAALADIGETVDEGIVEIDFSWSRSRSKPVVPVSHIVIPNEDVPVMREAARVLKATYWDDDFELSGPVVRLESHDAASGGEVFIYTPVEDAWRKVLVHLQGGDYEAATQAHAKGLEVHCRGRLRKEGRYFTLQDVREFAVKPDVL